jgi:hypothetical protein
MTANTHPEMKMYWKPELKYNGPVRPGSIINGTIDTSYYDMTRAALNMAELSLQYGAPHSVIVPSDIAEALERGRYCNLIQVVCINPPSMNEHGQIMYKLIDRVYTVQLGMMLKLNQWGFLEPMQPHDSLNQGYYLSHSRQEGKMCRYCQWLTDIGLGDRAAIPNKIDHILI